MCGRYASARSVDDLASTFGIATDDVEAAPTPDWNVAPTKTVPVVVARDGRPVLTCMRWGLVPSWADRIPPATLFNARIETVTDKPAFRDAIRARRCLLPADGWYEWMSLPDGRRIPHFVSAVDGSVLALAGIWERWIDAEGRLMTSAAIVTRAAPDALRHVHERAPVVLPEADWQEWLDPQVPAEDLLPAIAAGAAPDVQVWPVDPRVGDVSTGGPELTRRVHIDEQPPLF